MADGALRGRRAPALDRRRVELDRGRGARLTGEVRRDLVDAELHDHLRVGLHLGRRALAGRVVLDRLLEVPGRDPGEDRHRVRRALPAEAVAGAAGQGTGGARRVERSGSDGGSQQEEEEEEADEGRHRVLPFHSIVTLAKDVLPDAVGPADRVLRPRL